MVQKTQINQQAKAPEAIDKNLFAEIKSRAMAMMETKAVVFEDNIVNLTQEELLMKSSKQYFALKMVSKFHIQAKEVILAVNYIPTERHEGIPIDRRALDEILALWLQENKIDALLEASKKGGVLCIEKPRAAEKILRTPTGDVIDLYKLLKYAPSLVPLLEKEMGPFSEWPDKAVPPTNKNNNNCDDYFYPLEEDPYRISRD